MSFTVPPGGLAGFAQMTPASKRALFPGGSARRSRRTTKKTRTKTTRRARKASRGGRKIKFGSPAWRKKYKLGKKR